MSHWRGERVCPALPLRPLLRGFLPGRGLLGPPWGAAGACGPVLPGAAGPGWALTPAVLAPGNAVCSLERIAAPGQRGAVASSTGLWDWSS